MLASVLQTASFIFAFYHRHKLSRHDKAHLVNRGRVEHPRTTRVEITVDESMRKASYFFLEPARGCSRTGIPGGLYERIEQTNARAVGYVTALIVIDHRANVCKKWAGEKGLLTKWAALESNQSAVPCTPTLRR